MVELESELGELALLFAITIADPIQHHPIELQAPIRQRRAPGQSPAPRPPPPPRRRACRTSRLYLSPSSGVARRETLVQPVASGDGGGPTTAVRSGVSTAALEQWQRKASVRPMSNFEVSAVRR